MERTVNKAVRILSIDAKDLYNSNHLQRENPVGYNIRRPDGQLNTKKFINTFDYSLEMIKMREVYEKVYRRINFGQKIGDYEYTQQVINVTFKYSNKEFNRFYGNTYIRQGYDLEDVTLNNCLAFLPDGQLLAIQVNTPTSPPSDEDVEKIAPYFSFSGDRYGCCKEPKATHTRAELREIIYRDGFVCDGIKYVRFKRSAGSSRVGKCLFINEALYKRMHKWELCGLKIDEGDEIDLAAFESYISLTCSSIIDTVDIQPEQILVIDDFESTFKEQCVAVTFDGENMCADIADTEITNSIWDGQSLADVSLFENHPHNGMMLLRNRFFKSCCFNTNIQRFFTECGVTDVEQLNGRTLAKSLGDIKLITTPSSIKYLKFGSLDQWLDNLDPMFGLVKCEKRTHFFNGRMVQIHYQLLNSLQLTYQEVEDLVRPSADYIKLVKSDPCVFRYHIKYPMNDPEEDYEGLNTKNEIIYKLLGINDKFADTAMYQKFKYEAVKSFTNNVKKGHVLVNGNYSTLFGNPMEMLFHAVGMFDGKSKLGVGNIHCKRFSYGKELLGSRSPHVCSGNVWVAKNVAAADIDYYFNLSREIVCINSIGENLLERLSGADFDSDTVLLTDNPILLKAAKRNYANFAVPTRLIGSKKRKRYYTKEDMADLDIKTGVNKIGEIVNLSQELNTLMWDMVNNGASLESVHELYCDVAMLDVMSNIEIDSAKKEYPTDNTKELKKLKLKYERRTDDGRRIMPGFFAPVSRAKGYYDIKKKSYKSHKTTMDYLQKAIRKTFGANKYRSGKVVPFVDILNGSYANGSRMNLDQIYRVIDLLENTQNDAKGIWMMSDLDEAMKRATVHDLKREVADYIADIHFNGATMYMLLSMLEDEKYTRIQQILLSILFGSPNTSFFDILDDSRQPRDVLIEDPDNGDIRIYDFRFKKQKIE